MDEEAPDELAIIEIVRLATLGEECKIACDLGERLAVSWNGRARYRDTVRWGNFVLTCCEDHRLLSSVAIAERNLGNIASAMARLDQARALTPIEDAGELALTLSESGHLRAQQGDVAGAMDLYGQSLAIKEQIGNVRGKAGDPARDGRSAGAAGRRGGSDGFIRPVPRDQ